MNFEYIKMKIFFILKPVIVVIKGCSVVVAGLLEVVDVGESQTIVPLLIA
jgi:hypothetical protein